MKEIYLSGLNLKTFTEQDASDYCSINNINSDSIIELFLHYNELTDITGIKLFKNLEYLDLDLNKLTDISILKNLTQLKYLFLNSNEIKDISVLKNLINITKLNISNTEITDISVIVNLINLQQLSIDNLELRSDQLKYIDSSKNLNQLYSSKGFKDMSIIIKHKKWIYK